MKETTQSRNGQQNRLSQCKNSYPCACRVQHSLFHAINPSPHVLKSSRTASSPHEPPSSFDPLLAPGSPFQSSQATSTPLPDPHSPKARRGHRSTHQRSRSRSAKVRSPNKRSTSCRAQCQPPRPESSQCSPASVEGSQLVTGPTFSPRLVSVQSLQSPMHHTAIKVCSLHKIPTACVVNQAPWRKAKSLSLL